MNDDAIKNCNNCEHYDIYKDFCHARNTKVKLMGNINDNGCELFFIRNKTCLECSKFNGFNSACDCGNIIEAHDISTCSEFEGRYYNPENEEVSNSNNVDHPNHYNHGGVECIEAIKAATSSLTGIESFCTGNAIKYLFRWKLKNGAEDIRKAKWYIDYLLNYLEGDNKE